MVPEQLLIMTTRTNSFIPREMLFFLHLMPTPPGGGGYSIYPCVGRCCAAPHTLTLFKTNIADFPTQFKTEFRFLIPCLRHLTRILINKSL